jgi:hypothetical protein
VPEFERLVRQHGRLRVLFDMTGFPRLGRRSAVGGRQVRHQALHGPRAARDGR